VYGFWHGDNSILAHASPKQQKRHPKAALLEETGRRKNN
jgi:hypothetical protein